MNFAFYVSGKAGRLKKMLRNNEEFLKDAKLIISDDISNDDLRYLIKRFPNMTYILIDYMKLQSDKNLSLSDKMLEYFVEYQIDYCFCFGNHILKGQLLKKYENRIINFHPSLLPIFKGRNAIDQAINNNTFLLGCTAHFIDAGMDTGPIIMQCVMNSKIFGENNYDVILDSQIDMLRQIVKLIEYDRIVILPQF